VADGEAAALAALTRDFGNEPEEAAALYRRIIEADPKTEGAHRARAAIVERARP